MNYLNTTSPTILPAATRSGHQPIWQAGLRQNRQSERASDLRVRDLNQERFGLRVTARLAQGAGDLPHDISERLRVAREQAVAKRKVSAFKPAFNVSVNSSGAGAGSLSLGGSGDEPLGWWERLGSLVPLLALIVGLVGINVVQNENRAKEVAEVDAALLTDDLPPSAFTDPGFAQFLKARRELGQ